MFQELMPAQRCGAFVYQNVEPRVRSIAASMLVPLFD